jgi:Thioredoxin-like
MIPHERSLVKKLEGKPFVLIGVNSDRDPKQLKKDLVENQVTWRSFQNERKGDKAIATEWNVQGWPTLYLIDDKGVIKKKWLGSPGNEVLDKEVETLVETAANRK